MPVGAGQLALSDSCLITFIAMGMGPFPKIGRCDGLRNEFAMMATTREILRSRFHLLQAVYGQLKRSAAKRTGENIHDSTKQRLGDPLINDLGKWTENRHQVFSHSPF